MSTLRISDAPLLPNVDGTEKIPTGGRGDYAISVDQIKDHIFQNVGKEIVGLGNVDNTSDLDKPVSTAQQAALNLKADKTYVDTNLNLKADKTNVYTRSETTLALSSKADLVGGFIPESQIPSSFNDVLEFTTPNLPIIGESGKIYITTDNNKTWRWSGNKYVEISNGGISDSTLKLENPRKIANVDFDGTQNIDIPHNNLLDRNLVGAHTAGAILDQSGRNQQDINNSIAVKFLLADELGLTKWASFEKKPPYTAEEYAQAFENGERLTAAINVAGEEGYSKVVLERGYYPVLYATKNRSNITGIAGAIQINSKNIQEVDLNKSVIFAIFDSDNLNQYTSTWTGGAYAMDGAIMSSEGSRFLKVHNGRLRGDQYNRSFINPQERFTEQTYAFMVRNDCWYPELTSLVMDGFRGDSVHGRGSGYRMTYLHDNWELGGIDLTTGSIMNETGAFRTTWLPINSLEVPVIDGMVHINAYLGARMIPFRDDVFKMFFYDVNRVFLGYTLGEQSDPILIPDKTHFIKIAVYKDERTAVEVPMYKERLELNTGAAFGLKVHGCVIFNNMRGGLANVPTGTIIENNIITKCGSPLSGFPLYDSLTRYAINSEERYIHRLTIRDNTIQAVGSGVLANAKYVEVSGNTFRDLLYVGSTMYGTKQADISNNTYINCRAGCFNVMDWGEYLEKFINFTGNYVYDSSVAPISANITPKVTINHKGNHYTGSSVILNGGTGILNSVGNTYKDMRTNTSNAVTVQNANTVSDEYFTYSGTAVEREDTRASFTGKSARGINLIIRRVFATVGQSDELIPRVIEGVNVTSNNRSRYLIPLAGTSIAGGWTLPLRYTLKNMVFDGSVPQVSGTIAKPLELLVKDSTFKGDTYFSLVQSSSSATALITFENVEFDLTNQTRALLNLVSSSSTIQVHFKNCVFKRDTSGAFNLSDKSAGVTILETNCQFINVTKPAAMISTNFTSVTYNPPSIDADGSATTDVTLTGVAVGDVVQAAFSRYDAGIEISAVVSAANTVTVKFKNTGSVAVDLANGTLTVKKV